MVISNGAIILVLLASVTAYLLKGLVGFGPSLIIVPILSFFIDFKSAVVVTTLADISSSGYLFIKGRKKVKIKKIGIIIAGLLVGTIIGVFLFKFLSVTSIKKIFGIMIIIVVLKNFLRRNKKVMKTFKKPIGLVVGLIGGILGGLTNTNGPPIVLYLNKVIRNKKALRANLAAIFITDAIWRGVLFGVNGYIDGTVLSVFSFIVLPGLITGLSLGNVCIKKLNNKTISNMIEFVLLVIGSGLLLK
ncbi:TSUP family transporter [Candidatus Dojkabacteria bacterium]|nr:TSUP family transporter [Candidatus Dojkabacteria bacterium]